MKRLGEKQQLAFNALEELGGEGTANEVAELACANSGGAHVVHSTVRKRLNELVKLGYVREQPEKRPCSCTGKAVTVYEVVDQDDGDPRAMGWVGDNGLP